MPQPEPPRNVVLHYTDGTRQPVDCAYVGMENGTHQWKIITEPLPKPFKSMTVAMLPGNTSIAVPFTKVTAMGTEDTGTHTIEEMYAKWMGAEMLIDRIMDRLWRAFLICGLATILSFWFTSLWGVVPLLWTLSYLSVSWTVHRARNPKKKRGTFYAD